MLVLLFAQVHGRVTDQTDSLLPGVTVELRAGKDAPLQTITDAKGEYTFPQLAPGIYQITFSLVNFAAIHREVSVQAEDVELNEVMRVTLSSEISVTTKGIFFNLAEIENPAENLVG